MTIKVRVDKAECLRRCIDWKADTVQLDINPVQLTEKERTWIADHLKGDGSEFCPPTVSFKGICPPTVEAFLQTVLALMSEGTGEQEMGRRR
jgi:hypothetical protein